MEFWAVLEISGQFLVPFDFVPSACYFLKLPPDLNHSRKIASRFNLDTIKFQKFPWRSIPQRIAIFEEYTSNISLEEFSSLLTLCHMSPRFFINCLDNCGIAQKYLLQTLCVPWSWVRDSCNSFLATGIMYNYTSSFLCRQLLMQN